MTSIDDLKEHQREIEYRSALLGRQRYEKNIKRKGMSSSVGGRKIVMNHADGEDSVLQNFAKAIDDYVTRAVSGKAGRKAKAFAYLLNIDPTQAAYLTIRDVIDLATTRKTLNAIAIHVGNSIADHFHLLKLSEKAPEEFHWLMEDLKKSTSERHKTAVYRRAVAKHGDIDKLSWTPTDKMHLGVALVELFEESTGIIMVEKDSYTGIENNTPMRVILTPEAEEWLKTVNGRVFSPLHKPMVCRPRDWEICRNTDKDGNEFFDIRGGYWTDAMWKSKFIKSRDDKSRNRQAEADLTNVLGAVNAIQHTPWRVNRGLLAVAHELRDAVQFQDLYGEADESMPPKPAEDAPKSVWKSWKRRATKTYAKNAMNRSKRIASLHQLNMADEFEAYERIWFPHCVDFRGRVYPFGNFMNPQSDDLGKALLEFGAGKPLGESGLFWLKVHIANCFGEDKKSYDDRVQWTEDHMDQILDSGLRSAGGDMFWVTADKKKRWAALAACIEMAGALVSGNPEEYVSHLPIPMDGSCSGLQHYSAALRDPVVATEVNLVPRDKPGDIYSLVATKAQVFSDEVEVIPELLPVQDVWRGKVTRPMVKQPVMTLCYAATLRGWQEQIEKAIVKEKLELGEVKGRKAAMHLAQAVKKATSRAVVSATKGMEFLKNVARVVAKTGEPIIWTAPSGFMIEQRYMKNKAKRVEVFYKGQRMRLTVVEPQNAIDPQRQAQSIAPNFVHSLDASHLMATVNAGLINGLRHWSMIHDSFGVHACDTDLLHAILRETFIEQYAADVFENFREEVIGHLKEAHPRLVEKIPPVPEKGTLDIASVREAAYFFS